MEDREIKLQNEMFTFVHMCDKIYVRKGKIKMRHKEQEFIEFSKNRNGHFSTSEMIAYGFNKYDISQFVKDGLLEKVGRGQYILLNALADEFRVVQQNNSYMVYSNETALYLHDMTNRFPEEFTVTTKSGYHLRNDDLKVYYVKPEVFTLGLIEKEDPFGNTVHVYDKERTICDIIKNKNRIELQVYVEGIQSYFLDGKPQINRLAQYAKALGISEKVMEVVMLYSKP